MLLSPRTAGLLAICPALLALAQVNGIFLYVSAAWIAVLIALVLADYRLAISPDDWTYARLHESRLSLGAPNRIRLNIRLRQGLRATRLWIRDTPPDSFAVHLTRPDDPSEVTASAKAHHWSPMATETETQAPIFAKRILPREEISCTYWVVPPRRGDFRFGDLYVRWESPLGLVRCQKRLSATAPVKVFPNLADIRKYDLLVRRHRTWELGLRSTRRYGMGTEFEQLRDYVPDDEYRRIDWKATARRAKPISVDYETERSQNIVLLLDVGRMMQSRVGAISKLDYAINAALLLTYVATQKGDRVGLLTFADTVQEWISPRAGRGQFQRLLSALYGVQSVPVEPDYTTAFSHLAAHHRRRSLVIVITDLLESLTLNQLTAQLLHQAKRHLVLLVTLQTPEIQSIAHARAEDSETLFRRTVAARMLDERRLTLAQVQNLGVLALDVAANQLSVALIEHYLDLKSRAAL